MRSILGNLLDSSHVFKSCDRETKIRLLRWRTHDDGYVGMVDYVVTDTAHDCPPDRAQPAAPHNDHVGVQLVGGPNNPLPRALRLGASDGTCGLKSQTRGNL